MAMGWCVFSGLALAFLGAQPVLAVTAQATTAGPSDAAFSNNSGGVVNVAAYSEAAGIQNASVTPSETLGGASVPVASSAYGVGITSQAIPIPGPMKVNQFGYLRQSYTYQKPVAQIKPVNKSLLSFPGDQVSITSETEGYTGFAQVENVTNPLTGQVTPRNAVIAEASVPDGEVPPGDAGALAGDPISIPTGTYNYNPTISCSITDNTSGDEAVAQTYAVDASTFTSDSLDNFGLDGMPLSQTLWYVTVGEAGPVTSAGSLAKLEIDFELNPLALKEITLPQSFLNSLPAFTTTAQEIAEINQAVDNAIANGMAFSGNQETLNGFDPFPVGTTYSPLSNNQAYGDGAAAEVAAPVPASIWLMGCGTLVLLTRKSQTRIKCS